MKSIGIQFPFTETYDGGIINYTSLSSDAIKSNLTAFLTLKKGQRPMNNSLYSPLYDFIMEQWDEISERNMTSQLKEKLAYFFPEIEVNKIHFVFEEENNLLNITINYFITELKIKDDVSLSLVIQS